jgi:hypothetical protein
MTLNARLAKIEEAAARQVRPQQEGGKDRFEVCVFGEPTPRGYKRLDGEAAGAVVQFYRDNNLPMPEVES